MFQLKLIIKRCSCPALSRLPLCRCISRCGEGRRSFCPRGGAPPGRQPKTQRRYSNGGSASAGGAAFLILQEEICDIFLSSWQVLPTCPKPSPHHWCRCTPSSSSIYFCESLFIKGNQRRREDAAQSPASLSIVQPRDDCCCLRRVGVLVLSSCYMAFKIVALEHRLNSLASTAEHIHNG